MSNKIKYGLENVYYAKCTYDSKTGKYSYETPKRMNGGVNISLSASGSSTPFYADNILYYNTTTNTGYSGTLELAVIPDDFRREILGEYIDENGLQVESSDTATVEFALMFQFEGDVHARRHVLYRCSAERPEISGATKAESATPQTETLNITAMPRENDHNVKAFADNTEAGKAVYDQWFTAVKEPTNAKAETVVTEPTESK